MANYLERVAFSATRKAAVAKPPGSGPPLLPAGRDFSLPGQELFSNDDQDLFGESTLDERSRSGESGSSLHVEPTAKPSASPVSLANESAFTVHLPKTLRPVTSEKLPAPVPNEPTPDRFGQSVPVEERVEVLRSSDTQVKEPGTQSGVADARSGEPVRPKSLDHGAENEPLVKEIYLGDAVPEPRDSEGGQRRISKHDATPAGEPLPIAVPKQTPAVVVGSASRPEPSRITIGQFEVSVNNHAVAEPVRPRAAAPMQSNKANLEQRYLDRFRLRR